MQITLGLFFMLLLYKYWFMFGDWAVLLLTCIFSSSLQVIPLQASVLCFWSSIPPLLLTLSICVTYCFVISSLGRITYPPYCVQPLFLCMCLMYASFLYHTHGTISNYCCYIFSPLNQLVTVISVFPPRMHMAVIPRCILLRQWFKLLTLT